MHSLNTWRTAAQAKLLDLGLLALRVYAGQEFLLAGITKLRSGAVAPEWFANLHFPAPLHLLGPNLNWLAAGLGELVLGLMLIAGLLPRLAALGLMFITYVAVVTVHFDLGWAGWNQIETDAGQGFKVPLMLALMLFTILTQGGGRYSLSAWLSREPVVMPLPRIRRS